MRKVISLLIVLSIVLGVNSSLVASAVELENTSVSALLEPYIEVIEKVNAETGKHIYIPSGKEESVYNYYKDYSLKEFEDSLLRDISQSEMTRYSPPDSESMTIEYFPANENSTNVIAPRSVVEDITQSAPISHNSFLYLYSTVFGGGNPITYNYQSINSIGIGWPSDFTGFHFGLTSWSYSLSNNNRTCTVTINGSPQNAAGLIESVYLTETVTFNAN